MGIFNRPDLQYGKMDIIKDDIQAQPSDSTPVDSDVLIMNRLADHLIAIQEWKDRVDAFDYLIANAAKIAGNPSFPTDNIDIKNAMTNLGFDNGDVTFEIFKASVDIVVAGFQQMAVVSLSGVMNGN